MIDIIFNWLQTFPGLELLQRQQTDPGDGACGLYFRGVTRSDLSHDLLGNPRCRKKLRFTLRRYGKRAESAVFFLMLGAWIQENPPALGQETTAALQNARCVRDDDLGLSLWEGELELSYREERL